MTLFPSRWQAPVARPVESSALLDPGTERTYRPPPASPSTPRLPEPIRVIDEATAPRGHLSVSHHLAVLIAFALLVLLFTWPLARDPGHLLPLQGPGRPFHKDPMMYGWTMVSNTRRLLSTPLAVFHGNTFYPHGNVVAHSDLLLTPTLFPAGPVFLATGNPVLQYNVTLLVWWALSGWAMYVLAFVLLDSHAGAMIAAIAFALCPFRTDFFLEFQMQLAFPIPLAVLALLRFLESHRGRYLAGALALLWIEALASMYYAIILGLLLAVLTGLHLVLRAPAWRASLAAKGAGGLAALGLALAPFLVPYAQNRSELGLVRGLDQATRHSADVLTYLETGVTRLYHFRPSGHVAETSIFMGFVALALAGLALVMGDGPEAPPPPPVVRRARGGLAVATILALGGLIVTLVAGPALHRAGREIPAPLDLFLVALLLLLGRIMVEGWWAARRRERGPVTLDELRWVCAFLIVGFFLLSLGPVIHYAREPVGRGLYGILHPYLLPLQAMRVTSRIGIVVVLGVALLAGLGARILERRLRGTRARLLVAGAIPLLLAEYAPFPLPYGRLDWEHPPPVYRVLAADPDDVAVLEWPSNIEVHDDYFTFMSLTHWKRIVNGASGFSPMLPKLSHEISHVLSKPDSPDDRFPTAADRRYLLGIHPLRYVIVHNALIDDAERRKWRRLGAMPWATLVGHYGEDDLYRLSGELRGQHLEKLFSWDFARGKSRATFEARVVGPSARERWIEVALNGQALGRAPVEDGWAEYAFPLVGRRFHSAPNVVAIELRYHGTDAPDRRIARGPPRLLVGVRVAAPGTAIETSGDARPSVTPGTPAPELEVRDFELR